MAKNIIKNPILSKRAERDMNFDRVDVYPLKNANQEANVDSKQKFK